MGIIQRKSVRTTVVSFIGVAFGSITRLLMPLLLDETQIGLLQLLETISNMLITIFSLGFGQVIIQQFPRFRSEANGHHGFLLFGIIWSLIGIALAWSVFGLFESAFLKEDPETNQLFRSFSFLVFPLIFFRILMGNVDAYVRMLFSTVTGIFLDTFISKLMGTLAVIGLYLSWIDYTYFVYLFTLNLCLPGVVIVVYALVHTSKLRWPHRNLIAKKERRRISQFMLFGIAISASGSVVAYVDTLMIHQLLSLKALGIYTTLAFASRLIIVPSRGVHRISDVVIAEAWKRDDRATIQSIYEKSCLNQLLISVFLFGMGWAFIDPVLSLTENLATYREQSFVFFFMGIGAVVEMATGVNSVIIASSTRYRYNAYFTMLLAVLSIVFNLVFIQLFQLEGAALASMCSMLVVNFLRGVLLFKVYGFQPFTLRFFKAFSCAVGFILLCHWTAFDTAQGWQWIGVAIGLPLLFWGVVIAARLSPDINAWLLKIKDKWWPWQTR